MRLTVVVPTFRREQTLALLLPLLLAQLERLAEQRPAQGQLLVIDNDPARSAGPVVATLGDDRVRYLAEPRPGVAAVRNRALRETGGQRVAVFLDDDQVPTPDWLTSLAATWELTGAAAVAGPVTSVLPGEAGAWLRDGEFFDRSYRRVLRTGDHIPEVATTNLWLDLDVVRALGLRFDERFGLSGGEDSLFTRSLSKAGGVIVWCAEAPVIEEVPMTRLTRNWVCRRALSSGNTTARVDLALADGRASRRRLRVRLALRGAARLGGGATGLVGGLLSRSTLRQGRSARTAFRGWGMLLGAADLSYQEYARQGPRWAFLPVSGTPSAIPAPDAEEEAP